MEITLNLQSLGYFLLIVAGIVLLVILSVAACRLVGTLKRMNSILDDVNVVSSTVADKTKEVDNIIGDVSGIISDVTEAFKGNQNVVKAMTVLINSFATLKGLVANEDKKEEGR